MPFDAHERAGFLIDESRVAGISAEETAWLCGHLADCAECARREASTARMLGAMGQLSFGGGRRVSLAWTVDKKRSHVLLWLAAAAMVSVAAVPVYRSVRQEADAQLLERVGDHVSRTVPQALEPLMHTGDGQ
jgi:hypothetical protein